MEKEEKTKEEIFDEDYWYEHLIVERELFKKTEEAFKLPEC